MSGINRKRGQDLKEAESTAVPDSTTKDRSFCSGDDVLVQHKDGKFYLGTVVQVELIQEQCLVKFDDNTEQWSSFKNLTKLNVQIDVMCVICKKSQPKKDNEIVVCDRCARGYHQLCHQPSIATGIGCWECRRCQERPLKPVHAIRKAAPLPPPAPPPPAIDVEPPKHKLPYDLKSLVWDINHRVNSEHKYCYCGAAGDWFIKMLQCGRCYQWFHEKCVKCLHYPLHLGDRFYVFVCALCNGGKEFLRRFEMKWVDLVHLAIFNLTVYNAKKYHEVETDIVQYINSNWVTFQLPPKIRNTVVEERKKIVMYVLTNNRNRFKCGREIKKRATIWGLHVRIPPGAPMFILPPAVPLNDAVLKKKWTGNKRLVFLPPLTQIYVPGKTTDLPKGVILSSPGPYTEPPPGIRILHIDTRPIMFPKGTSPTGHKVCIKSSAPCFPEPKEQIEKRIRAQNLENKMIKNFRALKARKLLKNALAKSQKITQELPLTPPSSVSAPDTPQPTPTSAPSASTPVDTSGDDTSSSRTLDSFIPPPKDFEGKNNPFVSVTELLGSALPAGTPITLPLPLNPVITQPVLRPTKRRLSEKDIRINRNGEVKRRRIRRQCTSKNAEVIVPSASWNSAKSLRSMYNPTSSSNNAIDFTLNGRRLRRPKQKCTITVTPTSSPIKQTPTISLDDLKTSVNIYFGAVNRIASGEKFNVRGKRINQGRTQYLIEWESTTT